MSAASRAMRRPAALPFTDGVRRDYTTFKAVFPYLNTPIPGNFNPQ